MSPYLKKTTKLATALIFLSTNMKEMKLIGYDHRFVTIDQGARWPLLDLFIKLSFLLFVHKVVLNSYILTLENLAN